MKSLLILFFFFFILPTLMSALKRRLSSQPNVIRPNQDIFSKIINTIKQATTSRGGSSTSNSNINSAPMNFNSKTITSIVLGIGLVILLLNSLVSIPAGTTGVRTFFGKVQDREISSGLNLVNPLERINKLSIRTEEYTMSVAQGEGQRKGADQITALTNEGLPVDLDITAFYRLNEAEASDVFKDLGLNYQEKIIRPEIRSAIREVVARFDAKAIYSEKRAEVAEGIRQRLEEALQPRGIAVEQVLLRNVTLPTGLAGSIQQKLQAEQDAERLDFVLEKEKKEAERKRIEAQGQSDAQAILMKHSHRSISNISTSTNSKIDKEQSTSPQAAMVYLSSRQYSRLSLAGVGN